VKYDQHDMEPHRTVIKSKVSGDMAIKSLMYNMKNYTGENLTKMESFCLFLRKLFIYCHREVRSKMKAFWTGYMKHYDEQKKLPSF
jgi:hypothetical protein